MGREATCICHVGAQQAHTKLLLESSEIIFRGILRRTIPIASVTELRVEDANLLFRIGNNEIALELGSHLAAKWLAAMQKAPATLATKLGIAPDTRVLVVGRIDCPELSEAVAVGKRAEINQPDLIVARIDSQDSLENALRLSLPLAERGRSVWFIYTKGPSSPVGETAVRKAARDVGMRDTKVASVSSRLTALRCSLPK